MIYNNFFMEERFFMIYHMLLAVEEDTQAYDISKLKVPMDGTGLVSPKVDINQNVFKPVSPPTSSIGSRGINGQANQITSNQSTVVTHHVMQGTSAKIYLNYNYLHVAY